MAPYKPLCVSGQRYVTPAQVLNIGHRLYVNSRRFCDGRQLVAGSETSSLIESLRFSSDPDFGHAELQYAGVRFQIMQIVGDKIF